MVPKHAAAYIDALHIPRGQQVVERSVQDAAHGICYLQCSNDTALGGLQIVAPVSRQFAVSVATAYKLSPGVTVILVDALLSY